MKYVKQLAVVLWITRGLAGSLAFLRPNEFVGYMAAAPEVRAWKSLGNTSC